MKILTRYLFKEVLHHFRLFLVMFVVILLVAVVYDVLGDILKESPPVAAIVMYLAYSVPERMVMAFPLICMMSTIFSYGLLAKNKEVLAMVASGISFNRLAFPALVFGILLTGFMFWFNEYIVPASVSRANYIMNVVIKKKKDSIQTRSKDQFVKGKGNRFYYMENYDPKRREMAFPTILEVSEDGKGLTERIEAERGVLIPTGENTHDLELQNAQRWTFKPDGSLASYQPPKTFKVKMEEENLDIFLSKDKKPSEMNYPELREYVEMRQSMGDDVKAPQTTLQLKLAFPLSCLLMALLGFSVVADVHARHFARGVTLGLLVAIGFYLLNTFFTKMGEKGTAPPALAAWLPLAIFLVAIAVLLNRLKRIRG